MYCQNCGAQNDDTMSFCMNCGAPLTGAQPPAPPAYAPVRENASQQILRQQTKSPLYLTGAIVFSAAILLQLIAVGQGSNSLVWLVDRCMAWMLDYGGIGAGQYMSGLGDVIRFAGRGLTFGTILSMAPDILLAVGMWLMFAAARNAYGPMKTTGLTIIKVVTIVQMVFFCIGAVLLAAALLIAMVATSAYYDEIIPLGLIALLVLAVLSVPQIIYYIKLAGTANSMRLTAAGGGYNGKVSLYVAVVCFFGAAAALLGGFAGGLFGILSGLCRCAAWVIFGIYLIAYRNKAGTVPVAEPRLTPPTPAPAPHFTPQPPAPEPAFQPSAPAYQPPTPAPAFVPQKAPKDDTTVLNGSSFYAQETTVLAPEPSLAVRLIRLKDNTAVAVTPPQFRMGKDPSSADYFIGDNTAISRQHADILIHDDAAFVVDLHSTNHVYLNGQQIPPDTEIQLMNGAELRLGDEKFRVEIV